MRKKSRTEGVPADSCRSCTRCGKLLARNIKIEEQIYLSTAGKGLNQPTKTSNACLHCVAPALKWSALCCQYLKLRQREPSGGSI